MLKKLTRVLAFLLVSVMLLAACASGNGTESNGEKESTQPSDTTAAQGEAVSGAAAEDIYEIYMTLPTLGAVPEGLEDVENYINEIIEPLIGANLVLQPTIISELSSQNILSISSGDKLDLAVTMNEGGVANYVAKNAVLPLDDLYEQYGEAIGEALGSIIKGGYYDDTLYGIPVTERLGMRGAYLVRKDLLEEVGFDYDVNKNYTLDDLEQLFALLKEAHPDMYMLKNTIATIDLYDLSEKWDDLGANAASGVLVSDGNRDTTVTNMWELDAYGAYADRMYDWAQKGYFQPDVATNTDSVETLIASGLYAGTTQYVTAGRIFAAGTYGYELVPMYFYDGYPKQSVLTSIQWMIPVTCEMPDKAMQFLALMFEDVRIGNALLFGLEGETYDIVESDDEGRSIIQFVEGLDANTVPYYCLFGIYGDRTNIHKLQGEATLDYWNIIEAFNAQCEAYVENCPAFGYTFNSQAVASEYAAVQSVYSQYINIIAYGTIHPETSLPQFREALKSAGIDTVIAENQRQLDEWLAGK